jgi:CRP-like cAMP-binding protein
VVHEGDRTDFVYFVLTGNLKVMVSDEDGREVILTILGQGEMFGEMGVLDDSPRSASVVAVSPSDLVTIAKTDFKRLMQDNFELAWHVMCNLTRRLRDADRKIESLALMDVYGRVARLLLEMSEEVDGLKVVQEGFEAGYRQDDRRFPRDGQPGHEGSRPAWPDRGDRRRRDPAREDLRFVTGPKSFLTSLGSSRG